MTGEGMVISVGWGLLLLRAELNSCPAYTVLTGDRQTVHSQLQEERSSVLDATMEERETRPLLLGSIQL